MGGFFIARFSSGATNFATFRTLGFAKSGEACVITYDGRRGGRAIAKRGWRSLAGAFRAMPLLFIVTLVLGAGLRIAFLKVPFLREAMPAPTLEQLTSQRLFTHLGVHLGLILAWAAIVVPMAVAIHRFTLLGERSPGFPYRAGHTRNFFYWTAGLLLAFFIARSFSLLLMAVTFVQALTAGVIEIGIFIIIIQLLMMFPALALGVPAPSAEARIDASFRRMEGNFWLLVRTVVLTLLPLLVLAILLSRVMAGPAPPPPPAVAPPPAPITMVRLVAAGLFGVVQVAAFALASATASWLYAATRKDH
jgi:hypothetical protein